MNVVFDTNIYISALVFPGGVCDRLFRLAYTAKYKIFISPDILTEIKSVLTKKFKLSEEEAVDIIDRILTVAEITYPRFRVEKIIGPAGDNRILECALESQADFLVTGDKRHILRLKRFKETRIITPSQFLELMLRCY